MAEKILASIVIDDEALDAAQAKADKLLATLKEAAELSDRLTAKEKPPESGKIEDRLDPRCWDVSTRASYWGKYFPQMCRAAAKAGLISEGIAEYVAQSAETDAADGLCELFDKHLRRIAQATSQPQERRCTRDITR